MSVREEYLTEKLSALLNRRTMPRGLEGKPDVQAQEVQALVACLTRKAPSEAYDQWWLRVEEAIDEDATTRAWPTVGEIAKAVKRVSGSVRVTVKQGDEVDPLQFIGNRISNGYPVGDQYLYGRLARDLVAGGYVTEDQLQAYRSNLFFTMKDVWNEEMALAMEADLKKRHQFAEKLGEEVRISVDIKMPRVKGMNE